jgi:transglutaminase-like putative cysteine protease
VSSAARTAAISAPALVVVATAWLRLEQPLTSLWHVLALLALALAAALPRRRSLRLLAAVLAAFAAARVAAGVDLVPWRLDRPGSGFGFGHSLSALGTKFGDGFGDFYGTHLPYDPRVHVAMNELVLSGIFLFALGVTLLVAERKPVASALVLLVGAGWPATMLGASHEIAMGAAILAAALVLLAGLGSRRWPAFALPAVAVIAVAAVAVGSATAARHGLVHWQTWNLAHVATGPEDVGFVWNAQYAGLKWSGKPTTVLQVRSNRAPTYLRATVLDDFADDAWKSGPARPADSLEPATTRRPQNDTRESVTINALADTHLVGGSVPIRFKAAGGVPLVKTEPGFAELDQNLPHGLRYTVRSYTARPSAAELRRSRPQYPSELSNDGLLDVGHGVTLPAFGAPDRIAQVETLLTQNPDLNPYVPLARRAEQVAGGARTPYDAVADLENWFVASGKFRYTNHPLVISPVLVNFVTKTHAGYCQYFAGAMALMLRYLGVPARVAVGFAGGTYDQSEELWNVDDREAHAWVEVWFKGYGWLPFDPTPAVPGAAPRSIRGAAAVTAGARSGGSTSAPTGHERSTARGSSTTAGKLSTQNGFLPGHGGHALSSSSAELSGLGGSGHSGDRSLPVLLLLAAVAVAIGGIVLAKIAFRIGRSVRRDPRAVAAACRQELTAFLVDQRIETPRSATLGDLGELFRHEFGLRPDAFVAAATAARFGPTEDAAPAATTARRELRALLEAARRSLTRRDRLRGLLSLRSLVRTAVPTTS